MLELGDDVLRRWILFIQARCLIAGTLLVTALQPSTAFAPSPTPTCVEYVSSSLGHLSYPKSTHFLHNVFLLSLDTEHDKTTTMGPPLPVTNKLDAQSIQKLQYDEVVRILDPNTVKLKRSGLVSFAAVATPSGYKSNFQFPDCMSKSPSSKARQLLPAGAKVGIRFLDTESNSSKPRAALIVTNDGTLVNSELVRTGFARPVSRGREACEEILPGLTQQLNSLQQEAQDRGVGMYMNCDKQADATSIALDDQFEPLEFTVETQWGDDGGKPIVQQRQGNMKRPTNPGDTKGCSDFDYYEDALRWYEKYAPWYGDVAKLDPDHDEIPCPGLPHTKDQSRYRMKVPSSQ